MSDTNSVIELLKQVELKVSNVEEDIHNYKRAFYITGNTSFGERLNLLETDLGEVLTLLDQIKESHYSETDSIANHWVKEGVKNQIDLINAGNLLPEETFNFVSSLLGVKDE